MSPEYVAGATGHINCLNAPRIGVMKLYFSASHPNRLAIKAFSLPEALTAIAIVGLTSVALIAGIIYSFSTIRMARENLRANQVILEKMEVIRLLTWDQVTTPGFLPPLFTAPLDPGAQGTNGNRFAGSIVLDRNVPGLNATNYTNEMRRIRIDLSWTSGEKLRSKQLTTFIARAGIQNYVYN